MIVGFRTMPDNGTTQLVTRQHPARTAYECREQCGLAAGQLHFPAVSIDKGAAGEVELAVFDFSLTSSPSTPILARATCMCCELMPAWHANCLDFRVKSTSSATSTGSARAIKNPHCCSNQKSRTGKCRTKGGWRDRLSISGRFCIIWTTQRGLIQGRRVERQT
jgi:hypothetical protein